ncbi:MAG: hypothetical protein EB034_16445 [Verrucomicrobia bacterium]|nr:hypothetical protein [Verrucomicrobiota bacterium]
MVNRVQAGLGVTVGAAGSIVEQVAAVSAATGSAPVAGSGVTLNVTAPMFTNPVEIGTEIVDALEAYLRSNGSLPFAV